ncbi:MAG: hypothetical protein KDN18_24305, partial [Verrucomicrobiae bacterium]|nr:hypothetical protein [Verrucomicrobiae bacterium]
MSDPNPRISPQAETVRPVAAGRQRGGIVPGGGSRRLSPPYPVGTLGQLVDLPQENVLVSAFQAVNSIHGGLGCAAFRIEEGLALHPFDFEGETENEEIVAYAEAVVPGGILSERFLHAADSLLLQACEPVVLEAARSGEAIL